MDYCTQVVQYREILPSFLGLLYLQLLIAHCKIGGGDGLGVRLDFIPSSSSLSLSVPILIAATVTRSLEWEIQKFQLCNYMGEGVGHCSCIYPFQ